MACVVEQFVVGVQLGRWRDSPFDEARQRARREQPLHQPQCIDDDALIFFGRQVVRLD